MLAFTSDPSVAIGFSRGQWICERVILDLKMIEARKNDLSEARKRAVKVGVPFGCGHPMVDRTVHLSDEGRKALKE
jgi:hypothetical protein